MSTLTLPAADAAIEEIPDEERSRTVYRLKASGVTMANIAAHMKVSVPTLYRMLADYRKNVAKMFTERSRSELLLDHLMFVHTVRDLSMAEVHKIDIESMTVLPDGTIQKNEPDRKNKAKFAEIALNAEKMSFDMLHKTGVLPSAIREIHCTVQDTKPMDVEDRRLMAAKTKDELIESVAKLISNSRVVGAIKDVGVSDGDAERLTSEGTEEVREAT